MKLTEDKIKELDKSNIFQHIKDLGLQFEAAVERRDKVSFSDKPEIDKVILLGTGGGSSIASKLLKSTLESEITIPVFINQGYSVPKWVDEKTLAIAITVSGDTEETISAFDQALNQGAYGVGVTSGGKLKAFIEENNTEFVELPKTSMQARSVIGDIFVALLFILEEFKLLNRDFSHDLKESSELINKLSNEYQSLTADNPAIKIAEELKGFTPVIYSSDELPEVASVRWKNQFGENSKVISHWYTFPELNHDEIVGWEQDESLRKHFKLVYLRDIADHQRIKQRIDITKELLEARGVKVIDVNSQGSSKLARALSLIYLGDWVSIYLAFLNGIDPTPVNLIIEMKKKLQ